MSDSPDLLATAVKEHALEMGFQAAGITKLRRPPHFDEFAAWLDAGAHGEMRYLEANRSIREDPTELLPGASAAICVALNYNRPCPQRSGYPKIARYALGRDYHKVLRRKLRELGKWLEATDASIRCRACVDSAPILERDFAREAGLGWFGKNTCLIDSKRGSWFFIGILLTTAELASDEPSVGGCGTCRACIDSCPTGAIVFRDGRWQLDARHCISYLTIEKRGELSSLNASDIGDWTFGCDVCQEVCPFNVPKEKQPERASNSSEHSLLTEREWPSLRELAAIAPNQWDLLTRGSAVRRAGYDGLRRNARINLLNQAHVASRCETTPL